MDIIKQFLPDVSLNENSLDSLTNHLSSQRSTTQNKQKSLLFFKKKPSINTMEEVQKKLQNLNKELEEEQEIVEGLNQSIELDDYVLLNFDFAFQDLYTPIQQRIDRDGNFSLYYKPKPVSKIEKLNNEQYEVDIENINILKPIKKPSYNNALINIIKQVQNLNKKGVFQNLQHIGLNLSGWNEFPNTKIDDYTVQLIMELLFKQILIKQQKQVLSQLFQEIQNFSEDSVDENQEEEEEENQEEKDQQQDNDNSNQDENLDLNENNEDEKQLQKFKVFSDRNMEKLINALEKQQQQADNEKKGYVQIQDELFQQMQLKEMGIELNNNYQNSLLNCIQLQNIKSLSLNFYKLGYKNPQITQLSLNYILEALLKFKNLEICDLNLSSFGIIGDYETKKFYEHQHVVKICQFLYNNQDLKQFSLSARSWGYNNPNINHNSIYLLGKAIGSLQKLELLSLDLYCWTYQAQFDQFGTLLFLKELNQLQRLKSFVLLIDFFGNLNAFHFAEIINIIFGNVQLENFKISCKQSFYQDLYQATKNKNGYLNYQDMQIKLFEFLKSKDNKIKNISLCDQIINMKSQNQENKFRETEYQLIKKQIFLKKKNRLIYHILSKQQKLTSKFRKDVLFDIAEFF